MAPPRKFKAVGLATAFTAKGRRRMAATGEREEETIVERTLKGLGVDNGPDGRGDDPPPELLVKVKWRPETLDFDLHVAGDVGGDGTGDGTGDGAGRDVFFTAVNVRAPPNAPGTAEEWYTRARQALTGPKSRAHRHFSFTLDRAGAGASTEATFKWSWHEPTSRTDDPMPACVTAAAKGTRRVGVARMRGEAFVASNRHRIFAAFATKQLETRDERLARLERECESLLCTLHTARRDLERAAKFKEAAERDNTRRFAVLLNAQKVRLREQHELLEAARAENDDLRARVEETDEGEGDEATDDDGESEPDTDEEEATAARARSTGGRLAVDCLRQPTKAKRVRGFADDASHQPRAGSSQPSQKSARSDKGVADARNQNSSLHPLDDIFGSIGIPPAGGDATGPAAAADDDFGGDATNVSQTLASASARLAGGGGGGVGSAGVSRRTSAAAGGSAGVSRRTSAAAGGGGRGSGRGRGRPRQAGGKNPLEDINSLLGEDGL